MRVRDGCCRKPLVHLGLRYYRCPVCKELYLARPAAKPETKEGA
jgi:hypothetical protein